MGLIRAARLAGIYPAIPPNKINIIVANKAVVVSIYGSLMK